MATQTQFLMGLEEDLSVYLKPVDPDPDFIRKLGDRLTKPNLVSIEHHHNTLLAGILVAAGLASGALLVWLLRRLW